MKKLFSILFILALLSACGGGGSTTSNTTQEPADTTTPVDDTPTDDTLTETPIAPPAETPIDTGSTETENLDDALEPASYILVIFANDNQFLGVINTNKFDSYSICNQFGDYGSKFSSTSIWNKFSTYGSEFNSLSAFDDFTSTPPIIFIYYDTGDLEAIYYLTTNSILIPRINSNALLTALQLEGCNIER